MTEEMQELGRRAVACKGWKWMEGMQCRWQDIEDGPWWGVRLNDENGTWQVVRFGSYDEAPIHGQAIPNLSDPATVGCLEQLVIGAYSRKVVITNGNGWWSVETDGHTWDDDCDAMPSLAAALVAALEAAP